MSACRIHPDRIELTDPLLGDRTVAVGEVSEILLDRYPPELRLGDGTVLFVPKTEERPLALFGRVNEIDFVERDDVWGDLCEPYLDTGHTPKDDARVRGRLHDNGFEDAEIDQIRRAIRRPMIRYNSLLWDWCHLGHLDVLEACGIPRPAWRDTLRHFLGLSAPPVVPEFADRAAFRAWTDGVAARGRVRASGKSPRVLTDEEVRSRIRSRWEALRPLRSAPVGSNVKRWVEQTLSSMGVLDRLQERWREPERKYHGLRHLLAVLDALQLGRRDWKSWHLAALAAFFHDAVYDPRAADNEERSAELLRHESSTLIEIGWFSDDEIDRAAKLVLATRDPFDKPSVIQFDMEAAERLIDADFAVFASPPGDYRAYVAAVREEYSFVPDDAFRAGRLQFVLRLSAAVEQRGGFFRHAQPVEEHLARENLRCAIEELSQPQRQA